MAPMATEADERLENPSFGNIGGPDFRSRYPALSVLYIEGHVVPGLHRNFVPQGIDYAGDSQRYAVLSGYFCENFQRARWRGGFIRYCAQKRSAFYLFDLDAGEAVRLALLEDRDGEPLRWHAGGVAVLYDHLWLPDNFKVLRFELDTLLRSDEAVITMGPDNRRRIGVDSSGDFISAHDGVLWVGNFQRPGRGAPLPPHYLSLEAGTAGWTAAYRIDPDTLRPRNTARYDVAWGGRSFEVYRPDTALHHRNQVQGLSFIDDRRVVLSASWGDSPSVFSFHRLPAPPLEPPERSPVVELPDGSEIAIWALYDLTREIRIFGPPGAEGIAFDGEALLTAFEGGAMPYRRRWRTVEDRMLRFQPPGVTRIDDDRPLPAEPGSQ